MLGSSVGVRGWTVSKESQSSYPSYLVCGELPRVCAPTWRSLSGPSDSSKPVYPPTDRGLPGALGCFSLVREFAPRGDPRETKLFFPLLVTAGNCKRAKKCRKVCFPAGAHLAGWGKSSIHYRLWKCALLVSGLLCCTVFCFICHIKKMQVTLRVISPFYFILKIYFVLYVGAFCLHVCLCTTSMSGDQGAQKRSTDSLNLELQVLVSCCSTK